MRKEKFYGNGPEIGRFSIGETILTAFMLSIGVGACLFGVFIEPGWKSVSMLIVMLAVWVTIPALFLEDVLDQKKYPKIWEPGWTRGKRGWKQDEYQ